MLGYLCFQLFFYTGKLESWNFFEGSLSFPVLIAMIFVSLWIVVNGDWMIDSFEYSLFVFCLLLELLGVVSKLGAKAALIMR